MNNYNYLRKFKNKKSHGESLQVTPKLLIIPKQLKKKIKKMGMEEDGNKT